MSASKKRKSKYQKPQDFLLRHMKLDNFMFFILDMWRHSPLKGGILSRQVFQLANLLATWQTPAACHLATWQNSPTSSDWAQLTLISQKRMNKVSVQRLKYVLSEVLPRPVFSCIFCITVHVQRAYAGWPNFLNSDFNAF